jgi:DNA-binding CsgD family transcriptional regulator
MRRGVIDGYEARRYLQHRDGSPHLAAIVVRDLEQQGFPHRALAFVTSTTDRGDPAEVPRLDPSQPDVCAGSTDADGVIDRISPEIESLVGMRSALAAEPVAAHVHTEDVACLDDALSLTVAHRVPVGVNVRFRRHDGEWTPVRLVVAADDQTQPPRLGFAIAHEQATGSDAASEESRAEQLERTLQRISNEIQALGLAPRMAALPSGDELPELADLSARQWEIVSRLAVGERVPSIARSMFLSQSTIRNHLSAVFRKLGVHSQSELIELLRARSSGSPSDS